MSSNVNHIHKILNYQEFPLFPNFQVFNFKKEE